MHALFSYLHYIPDYIFDWNNHMTFNSLIFCPLFGSFQNITNTRLRAPQIVRLTNYKHSFNIWSSISNSAKNHYVQKQHNCQQLGIALAWKTWQSRVWTRKINIQWEMKIIILSINMRLKNAHAFTYIFYIQEYICKMYCNH